MHKQVPGMIRNVRFENVTIEGRPGEYLVQIEGADAEHDVRGVTFETFSILGSKLTERSAPVRVGKHTGNVRWHTDRL